ncbi:MAG: Holliday junction resolvase RecU [Alkalibacterium sp.]|nr:Holliday junction resolvase RecU [Alkalibacterium sp.]
MKIHYPNGKPYLVNDDKKKTKNQLNKKKVSYSNRGMTLEEDLNRTNEYYLAKKRAVIHKKPIPIQVVNVDYPHRSAAKITEAYYKKASTTDYNGVYAGHYIDFEAKETRNKTSFPLKNFHEHQLEHMEACAVQGGVCFVIIRFSTLNRVFLLDFSLLKKWWQQQFNKGGKKSIPLSAMIEDGHELQYSLAPRLPYLDIIDTLYSIK